MKTKANITMDTKSWEAAKKQLPSVSRVLNRLLKQELIRKNEKIGRFRKRTKSLRARCTHCNAKRLFSDMIIWIFTEEVLFDFKQDKLYKGPIENQIHLLCDACYKDPILSDADEKYSYHEMYLGMQKENRELPKKYQYPIPLVLSGQQMIDGYCEMTLGD